MCTSGFVAAFLDFLTGIEQQKCNRVTSLTNLVGRRPTSISPASQACIPPIVLKCPFLRLADLEVADMTSCRGKSRGDIVTEITLSCRGLIYGQSQGKRSGFLIMKTLKRALGISPSFTT